MKNYTILVNAAPFSQQGSITAYNFAKAVLKRGHRLGQVFFYGDGIHNGNKFIAPPQDETNLVTLWQELAEQHSIQLIICVAAAQRRGLLSDSEPLEANVAKGFVISGLGQLVTAMMQADRFVVFN